MRVVHLGTYSTHGNNGMARLAAASNMAGLGAFAGESAESHCNRVYADCPDLLKKCLNCIGLTNPFTGECLGIKPYTDVGKKLRGLPDNYQPGQCPGAQAPPPPVQPAPPPVVTPSPGPIVVPVPTTPQPGPGPVITVPDNLNGQGGLAKLLTPTNLLIAAVGAGLIFQFTRRPRTGAVNGYRGPRSQKRRKATTA